MALILSIYSNKACRLSYIFQGFKNASKAQSNWGPALPENRTGRYADTLVDVAHSETIEKNGVIAMDEKEKDLVEHYKMRREMSNQRFLDNKGYEADEIPQKGSNGHTVQSEEDKF